MKEYLQKYRSHFVILGFFVFLLHGAKLHSNILGIDSEALIRLKDGFYYSWFVTGRQGRVFLKYLLGNSSFNPYFNAILTLLMFVLCVSAFFLLWDRVWERGNAAYVCDVPRGRNNAAHTYNTAENMAVTNQKTQMHRMGPWIWGGLLWISHPIMTEQLYFSLQSVEILCSFLLTALALYLSLQWVESVTFRFRGRTEGAVYNAGKAGTVGYAVDKTDSAVSTAGRSGIAGCITGKDGIAGNFGKGSLWKKAAYMILAVLLLILTFSNYQVFVAVYIFGVVSILVLQGLRELAEGIEQSPRLLFARVGLYLLVFLAAFSINTVITNLFFSSSDYIQNQVLWSSHRFVDCLRNMCGHVFKVLTGYNSIFFHLSYGMICVLSLVLVIGVIKRFSKNKGTGAVLFFFWLALQTTPFLMSIFLGGAPVIRSQLVLPIMTGFLAYLDFRLLEALGFRNGKRTALMITSAGLVLICLAGGISQAQITESLYYTEKCRYEQDEAMGYALIERIRQVNAEGEELPVMVIGRKEFEGNNSCVLGEVMGKSFFDYDMEAEPEQFWSTWRVLGFLHTLGADFPQVTEERIPEATEYSVYMPSWPAEDSVQIYNGMIIVKLSDFILHNAE